LGASQVIHVPLFIVARVGVIHSILDQGRDERGRGCLDLAVEALDDDNPIQFPTI
jgi:hypothetical protein